MKKFLIMTTLACYFSTVNFSQLLAKATVPKPVELKVFDVYNAIDAYLEAAYAVGVVLLAENWDIDQAIPSAAEDEINTMNTAIAVLTAYLGWEHDYEIYLDEIENYERQGNTARPRDWIVCHAMAIVDYLQCRDNCLFQPTACLVRCDNIFYYALLYCTSILPEPTPNPIAD